MGSAIGLAALTALSIAYGGDHLGNPAELTDGFHAAFLGAAGVALAGGLVALAFIQTPGAAAEQPAEETERELARAA